MGQFNFGGLGVEKGENFRRRRKEMGGEDCGQRVRDGSCGQMVWVLGRGNAQLGRLLLMLMVF